ncbi:MAG: TIGR00725 family protein [Nitrospinae bacterium]|nr:TIGR00725 family protein [Nitrospinota bacterium]
MWVGVIGSGLCNREIYETAEEIGFWIGSRRHVLVCGGMGGVMEAAAKGAKRGGGETIGILPGAHASEANPYINYPIITGMGHARNVIIARSSDILVAVSGEFGTLSEIAMGLKIGKPVLAFRCKWEGIEGVVPVRKKDELFAEMEKYLR